MATPDLAPGEVCTKCGQVHNLTLCKAHLSHKHKDRPGQQCQHPPMHGQKVCQTHGGRAPGAVVQGRKEYEAAVLKERLGKLTIVPVDNPLLELQRLAGEAVAWKNLMADHVAKLTSMRYGTEAGEAIRGEVQLFERAMDRCGQILGLIAKLNIDERLVAIEERRRDMILAALEAGLSKAGLSGVQAVEARKTVAAHLRIVSALPAA